MEGMNLLALDLGTHTGWALWEDGRVESGVQAFELKRGESPGMRYVRFNRWLEEMVRGRWQMFGSLGIVYEQPHQRGGAATEIAAGFSTHVQAFCARNQIEHAAIHSATLKKWTTGSGRASKDEMIVHVQARFTAKRGLTNDEADAIALLHYARAELLPEERKTR